MPNIVSETIEESNGDDESDHAENSSSEQSTDCMQPPNNYIATDLAVAIHEKANLSLSQTIKVLSVIHEIYNDNRFIPPTRSGLFRACDQRLNKPNNFIFNSTLRFDGKTYFNLYGYEKISIIAICFDDNLIGFKEIPDKKANTVFNCIDCLLCENKFRPSLAICDTEPTNTGRKNGVIKQLEDKYPFMKYEPCRIHILDLILKHQIQSVLHCQSTSADLCYYFISPLRSKWSIYKDQYLEKCNVVEVDNFPGLPNNELRRNDYKFLLKLVKAVKFFRSTSQFSFISNIPNNPTPISNARWNSKAIYFLFAELSGFNDENILEVNSFIIDVSLK